MHAGRKERLRCPVASSEQVQLQSEAERFVESLQSEEASFEEPASESVSLQAQYDKCKGKVRSKFSLLKTERLSSEDVVCEWWVFWGVPMR